MVVFCIYEYDCPACHGERDNEHHLGSESSKAGKGVGRKEEEGGVTLAE